VTRDKNYIKIAGLDLRPMDFNREKDLNSFIEGIREVKGHDCTKLYIDNQRELKVELLQSIGLNTGLQVFTGENTREKYLPIIIEKIFKLQNDRLEGKEILIVCEDKEKIKNLIKLLSRKYGLISIVGCREEDREDIYQYALEEIGLSLFFPLTIDEIIGNYSIIINYMDLEGETFSKKKRNCVVFDFGTGHNPKSERKPSYIRDLAFILEKTQIGKDNWIGKTINSSAYDALSLGNYYGKILLFTGKDYYSAKEYLNTYIKVKGSF